MALLVDIAEADGEDAAIASCNTSAAVSAIAQRSWCALPMLWLSSLQLPMLLALELCHLNALRSSRILRLLKLTKSSPGEGDHYSLIQLRNFGT